jgi:hypothetical protein
MTCLSKAVSMQEKTAKEIDSGIHARKIRLGIVTSDLKVPELMHLVISAQHVDEVVKL